jgi:dTDP-4-dehydrorhamnose 3,5-epimerase
MRIKKDPAEFFLKSNDYRGRECERCIIWNYASSAINWRIDGEPLLFGKDAQGVVVKTGAVLV